MSIVHFVNTHGVECILVYLVFAGIVGSMPPLPDDATWGQKWAYTAAHTLAMNFRKAFELLNVKLPDSTSSQGDKS